MSAPSVPTTSHRLPVTASTLLGACVVAALAVATYIGWMSNYLVSDSWALLGTISQPEWTLEALLPFRPYPLTINSTSYYAPVLVSIYWFAYKFGGFVPERQHLLTLLFHMGTTLLLFSVCLQLTGSRLKATLAGAIFAVHFASTEAVGWFGAISHPSAAFFGIGSLLFYIRYLQTNRRWWQAGAFLSLLLAILTQVTALPWVAILAILDLAYSGQFGRWRDSVPRLAMLGVFLVAAMALQIPAVSFSGRGGYSYQLGPWIVRNFFFYPVSIFMPALAGPSLSLTRDLLSAPENYDSFARLVGMNDAFNMLFASASVLVVAALVWSRGNWLLRFCLVSFFVATTPFLPINGHGYRYLYVPLMFFSIGAASLAVDFQRRVRDQSRLANWAMIAAIPIFVVLCFGESQRQLFWWQQAGFTAHRSLMELQQMQPSFPQGAKVLFGGLPDTIDNTNAQVWRNGMREAARAIYNDRTLRVEAYTKAEVERLFREELKGAPNTYGFVWEDRQLKRIAP